MGCGVWVGVVVGRRLEVSGWGMMCRGGGRGWYFKGWGWGMRWWVEFGGGGPKGGPTTQ